MIIEIRNNPQKGPGYARIILNGRAGSLILPGVQGIQPQFMIECPGRGEYLGRGQWTQAESRLVPDAFSFTGETLVLEVGPEVVDNLEALENYRFTLLFPGFAKSGALVCNNLIPSPMQSGRTQFGRFETEPQAVQASAVPPNPPAQEQDAPQAPPQAAFSPVLPSTEPMRQGLPADAVPANPQSGLNERPVSSQKSSKLPLIVTAAVLLLLAGIAIVYFMNSGENAATAPGGNETMQSEEAPVNQAENASSAEENSTAESQETPAETALPENPSDEGMDAPTDIPQDTPEESADESIAPPASEPGALQSARELLRRSPADDEIRRALSYMPLTDDNADGNFLLREELAQRGDAESMFLLAQFYDPVINAPAGSIEKDAEQALYWYGQAKAKGWQSAAPAIEQLKTWLQDAAGQGNPEAARLLETLE